jgi:hypothetical protein
MQIAGRAPPAPPLPTYFSLRYTKPLLSRCTSDFQTILAFVATMIYGNENALLMACFSHCRSL